MKYIVSLAILALLGSTNAIRVRDFDDDDEFFIEECELKSFLNEYYVSMTLVFLNQII